MCINFRKNTLHNKAIQSLLKKEAILELCNVLFAPKDFLISFNHSLITSQFLQLFLEIAPQIMLWITAVVWQATELAINPLFAQN